MTDKHAHMHEGTPQETPAGPPEYAEAISALGEANDKMHQAMALAPSGDLDRDFAAGMLAHHEGAVDMARVELRFGRDPALRQLAETIISAQEQEIAMMRDWLSRGR
jgi:uncharacterized protein (DUF305 family)